MEITEVRIKLMDEAGDRLQAFCSITFDDAFVVRDLKIIDGTHGPFVAMPSRKLTSRCPQCSTKNHLRAAYCNQCGVKLKEDRAPKDDHGRAKLYADIAHPINTGCREMIQERIIREFFAEIERSKQPGYVSRYEEFDAGEDYTPMTDPEGEARSQQRDRPHELPGAPHHSLDAAPASPELRRTQPRSTTNLSRSASPPPSRANSPQAPKHAPPPTPPQNVHREGFGAGIF